MSFFNSNKNSEKPALSSEKENLAGEKSTASAEASAPKGRKRKRGEINVADSGNVKEVARQMISFEQLLKQVQIFMSQKYSNELYAADKRDIMKQLIKQFMKDNNYYIPNVTLAEAAERLYVEMAEYSFLTPYLQRKDIEEININAWDDIQIIPSKGRTYKLKEHFTSPQHAIDVIRRLLHNNKLVFDASRPIVTGYLGKNIRITAVHTIVVGEDIGVTASIRIVNASKISKEQFIEYQMCEEEMYDFLLETYIHGISQVYAGGTGSGKTTFMADIMSRFPHDRRLITIEKSVREFDLVQRDENGEVVNNVVHMVTHDSDDESKSVTMQKLLTASLTMDPDSICVAEMKNEEAWEAQEAARTGHTVLTTTHASNIQGIYSRLATLCLQKYSAVPYDIIISLVTEAFPIGVFLKKLDDGKRHIMEIAECESDGKGNYTTRTLWKYEVLSEIQTEHGVEIDGRFVRVSPISENLSRRLHENGIPYDKLRKFTEVQ